jgi:iron complex outermembrane receptor protein
MRKLLLTVSALTLAWCGAAHAQAQAQSPAAASADAGAKLEELVVTAERRGENLQQTSIAATVLTGADLTKKGVATVDQLQFVSPSVTVSSFGQGNFFNIRGIGKEVNNTGTTVGVITYRDGVATFPGFFQTEPYYDLASVEILRGPQGTFVGQNSTGGAVLITENNPSLTAGYTGYVRAQAGTYADAGVQGAVNLPISDTLAARVAFNTERRDSFWDVSGPFTGHPGELQEASARVSLLWKPVAPLTVLFKTDLNYIDQGGYPADPATATNNPFKITNNADNLAIDSTLRSVLHVDYVLPNGITLRSVSGYRQGRSAAHVDSDGTSLANFTLYNHVNEYIASQEFNIVSPDSGPFRWVAGLYYQKDTFVYPTGGFLVGAPRGVLDETIVGKNPNETKAIFGQTTFELPHDFELQVGLRYSDVRSTNHATIGITQLHLGIPDNQTEAASKLTGKVALNWKLDADNFLYAFVATGFKSGGLNVPLSFTLPPTFGPESVTDYEAGWKSTWLDGHVKTQLGAYYNDYKNLQVSIGNPIAPTVSTELNVASTTEIYGVEASAQAVFGPLSLDGGLSVSHSRLGDFFAVDTRTPQLAACNTTTGPAGGACRDLSGRELPYAPTFTLKLGAQYVFQLGSGTLTPRIDYSHIAPQWATLFHASTDRLTARNIVNAQVAYQQGPYVVSLYSTNLTDQTYLASVQTLRYAAPPRQVGVRVTRDF